MSRNSLILAATLLFAAPGATALAGQPAPRPAPTAAAPSAAASTQPRADSGGRAASSPRKGKGSGFWTSDVPAEGNKYRYGMMAVGAVIALMMGLFVIWLIRRHTPARE